MSKRRSSGSAFEPHFEGKDVLDALLEASGAQVDCEGALDAMRQAHAQGVDRSEVIPSFFEGEPRPPNPDVARQLFENLLGLWELVAQGKRVDLSPRERPPKVKREPPAPPRPFEGEAPTAEYVDAAWRYLEAVGTREQSRLLDAFENRQDALLSHLDDSGLSDEGYATARQLCFEVFAFLELGVPGGTRSVRPEELTGRSAAAQDAPPALTAYVDEALFEAQHDEEQPLSHEETARVRERVMQAVAALWNARRT